MNRPLSISLNFLLIFLLPMGATAQTPAVKKMAEIKVTLFGQPCALSGPFSEKNLKLIHSISPEQIPWPKKSEQIPPQLQLLKQSDIPAPLLIYTGRMEKRLLAWQGYLDLEKTKPAIQIEYGEKLKSLVPPLSQSSFSKNFQELLAKNTASKEKVSELFQASIEPDPQEEFHRVLNKINVRYVCAFEDSEQSEQNDE